MILFISEFIIMFMFHAITAMVLESTLTTRLGGNNNGKSISSLAFKTSSSVE